LFLSSALHALTALSCLADEEQLTIKGNTHVLNIVSPIVSQPMSTLFQELQNVTEPAKIEIVNTTLPRSLREVSQGRADFHYPILCNTLGAQPGQLLRDSSIKLGIVHYILVTKDSNPLTKRDLLTAYVDWKKNHIDALTSVFSRSERQALETIAEGSYTRPGLIEAASDALQRDLNPLERELLAKAGYPYTVLSQGRLPADVFGIPTMPSSSATAALGMVKSNRADATISPVLAVFDAIENVAAFSAMKLEPYQTFDVCFAVANNTHGSQIDKLLGSAFQTLKEKGIFEEIFYEINAQQKIFLKTHEAKLNDLE